MLGYAQDNVFTLAATALAPSWKLGGDHLDGTFDPKSLWGLTQIHRFDAIGIGIANFDCVRPTDLAFTRAARSESLAN
jgi:hypothetical protein